MIIKTFYSSNEDLVKKVEELAHREKKSFSEITNIALMEYYKVHGEGNPQYTIKQYIDNPSFSAYPAIASPIQNRRVYFYNLKEKGTPNDINELRYYLQEWVHLFEEYLGSL